MLKKFLFMLFVFSLVLMKTAYSNEDRFKVGILGGPNISFISFETYYNFNLEEYHKTGLDLQIYTDYQLSESFDISSGIKYSVISTKFKDNTKLYLGVEIHRHLTFTQKYILIPIKIKYFPNSNRNLYLISGAEFGYQESSELLAKFFFTSDNDNEYYDYFSAYNKYIEFISIGIGYKYEILSLKTVIELNYFKGLFNNLNDNYKDFFYFNEWITNKLTLNFGVEF